MLVYFVALHYSVLCLIAKNSFCITFSICDEAVSFPSENPVCLERTHSISVRSSYCLDNRLGLQTEFFCSNFRKLEPSLFLSTSSSSSPATPDLTFAPIYKLATQHHLDVRAQLPSRLALRLNLALSARSTLPYQPYWHQQ